MSRVLFILFGLESDTCTRYIMQMRSYLLYISECPFKNFANLLDMQIK